MTGVGVFVCVWCNWIRPFSHTVFSVGQHAWNAQKHEQTRVIGATFYGKMRCLQSVVLI